MSYFLGFYPPSDSCKEIKNVSASVKDVFSGLGLDVRWCKGEDYYMSVAYLGEGMSFIKRLYFNYKMKNFSFKPFDIRFGTVKLGSSRRYKELIFLEVLEGGDDMRNLCLQVRNLLGLKDNANLVPRINLGRISKEISQQEYSNIVRDLSIVSKGLKIKDIKFTVSSIDIINA